MRLLPPRNDDEPGKLEELDGPDDVIDLDDPDFENVDLSDLENTDED